MTAMTDTSPDFWTKLARKYAALPIKDTESYEATLARTLSYLRPDDEVLEIGAGTSSTALRLAPSVKRYISSDFAPGMVEVGKEKAWEAGIPSLSIVEGGLGDDSIGIGPYNAVLALNVLHLLPDLHGALRLIAGLLPDGGLLISKTPCMGSQRFLFGPMIAVMRLFGRAPYVNLFTPAQLEAEIREAGFELVEAGSYPQIGRQRYGRQRYIVARKL